jgi:hypothetical protein
LVVISFHFEIGKTVMPLEFNPFNPLDVIHCIFGTKYIVVLLLSYIYHIRTIVT